jgi:alkylhydroperoxidase/carboxymuconolactone decarboxylase family protein YurZ
MIDVDTARFTVGVFQDVAWADKGIDALKRAGLPAESLSMLAKESPEVAALMQKALGAGGDRLDISNVGVVLARGPIMEALQGQARDLSTLGLARTMRRVGFQSHDARIYEVLTARGGVLVAIHSEPRAADALAVLMSYGGGNAAIGAWIGRV